MGATGRCSCPACKRACRCSNIMACRCTCSPPKHGASGSTSSGSNRHGNSCICFGSRADNQPGATGPTDAAYGAGEAGGAGWDGGTGAATLGGGPCCLAQPCRGETVERARRATLNQREDCTCHSCARCMYQALLSEPHIEVTSCADDLCACLTALLKAAGSHSLILHGVAN